MADENKRVKPPLDFLDEYVEMDNKGNVKAISADFVTYPLPKDIITRGGEFYAVWDKTEGLWNTSKDFLYKAIDEYVNMLGTPNIKHLYARKSSSKVCDRFNHYCKDVLPEKMINGRALNLNEKLTFKSDKPKREDYASIRLPYDLVKGEHDSFDTIMNTLYDPDEAHKIIWCIGSIFAGESVNLQKFLVLYGPAGAGKSTISIS